MLCGSWHGIWITPMIAEDRLAYMYVPRNGFLYEVPMNMPDWVEQLLCKPDSDSWQVLITYIEELLANES